MKLSTGFLFSLCFFNSSFSFAHEKPTIIGYFTNWGVYGANYQVENIPPQVDEVAYAFAQVGSCASVADATHPDGYATEKDITYCAKNDASFQKGLQDWKLHSTDFYSDFKNQPDGGAWGKGNIGKLLNTGKPVILSIGGWSLSAPLRNAIKPENRTVFINSIIDFLDPSKPIDVNSTVAKENWNGKKFSGVDIDWEPNGNMWTLAQAGPYNATVTQNDLINYKNFLTELKSKLTEAKNKGILSDDILRIAMTANPSAIKDVDKVYGGNYWAEIANSINSIDAMTYDYHGSFDTGCTAFNAALWNDSRAEQCSFDKTFSMQGTVEVLHNEGVPYNKIVTGIPAYGRGYIINSIPNDNPYIPFSGGYNVPGGDTTLTNRAIYTGFYLGTSLGFNFLTNLTTDYLAGQNYSWSWNSTSEVFVTFDNATTAQNKMAYVSGKTVALKDQLQGIMVWSLDGDVRNGDLDSSGKPIDYNKASILYGLGQ